MDHSSHDHSAHDHSSHASSSKAVASSAVVSGHSAHSTGGHAMAMVFNFGYDTELLFSSFKTTGPGSMYVLCIIVFAMSFGHEYLQYRRGLMETRYVSNLERRGAGDVGNSDDDLELSNASSAPSGGLLASLNKLSGTGGASKGSLEKYHLIRTLYHVGSSFTSLVIMTVFMSLNVWLVGAILAGTGLGFYMFQAKRGNSSKGLQCH
ncbi:Ctr copper transporter family-domain-containing protein [Chytriomyces sp. MP71]|nr:Ctr copper transporter family-domain-containing protein [Chytriomyces sp. MP71]